MKKIISVIGLIGVSVVAGILVERMFISPQQHFGPEVSFIPIPQRPMQPPPVTNNPTLTNVAAIDAALAGLPTIGGIQDRRLVDDFLRRIPADMLPIAAARSVQPSLRLQPFVMMQICWAWSRSDPESAARFVLAQEADQYQDRTLRRIVEEWANRDLEGLTKWAEQHSSVLVHRVALPTVIRGLMQADPGRAVALLGKLPTPGERQLLIQDVYPRWIEADPAAASRKLLVAFLPNMPGENYLRAALAAWFHRDPAAVFQGIKSAPDTTARRAAVVEAATIMGATQPTNVMDLIQTVPVEDSNRQFAVGALARAMAVANPPAALTWAKSLKGSKDRDAAVQQILGALQERNSESLREFIESEPNDPAAQSFAGNAAREMAGRSPTNALAWAQRLPPSMSRSNALVAIFQAWTATRPAEAMQTAATMPEPERTRFLNTIFQTWAWSDPNAAANELLTLKSTVADGLIYTLAATALVRQSPGKAQEWALKMPAGETRAKAAQIIVETLSMSRPSEAAQFVERFPSGEATLLVDTLFGRWFRFDSAAVASWAERLSDPALQGHAYRQLALLAAKREPASVFQYLHKLPPDTTNAHTRHEVALLWGRVEPLAAAEWASRQSTNLIFTNTALMIASEWAWKEPGAAARFVLSVPATDARKLWFQEFVSRWSRSDPQSAANWILNSAPAAEKPTLLQIVIADWASRDSRGVTAWALDLKAGPGRDLAASAVARSLSTWHPVQAAQIGQTVEESQQRWNILEHVARNWMRQDPAAARRWLTTNSMPRARKDSLFREFR